MPRVALVILVLLVALGCAARPHPQPQRNSAGRGRPAIQVDLREVPTTAGIPLAKILPPATLPAPTTAPAGPERPPLEALALYAEACDNLLARRRLAAITLLEKAVALDPGSYELHAALGRAYLGSGGTDPRSVTEMERAAEIDPDHVELQTDLGRQYLARGDTDKALWHLRLALNTTDYATDEAAASVAELFAGRALARSGYHSAALEVYERLLRRLRSPSFALRGDPEVAYLLARPDLLTLQIAESCEQVGRYAEALAAYDAAARRDPNDFNLRARSVRVLLAMRRYDDAIARAADAVSRSDAGPAALDLLSEAGRAAGREGAVADELRRLRRQRPGDTGVLFALADVLRRDGKPAEAFDLLRPEGEASHPTGGAVRRMYECATDLDPTGTTAARFLVAWSARHPDALHLLADRWNDLTLPTRTPHLTLRLLRGLTPGPEGAGDASRWEAAKWFWVAQVARLCHRQDVARDALGRAVHGAAVFAPPFRAAVGMNAGTGDDIEPGETDTDPLSIDSDTTNDAARPSQGLPSRAAAAGDPALAAELRGRILLEQKKYADARKALDEAAKLGGAAPELQFARAAAARGAGDEAEFERLLWKLVSDWPDYDAAYEALYTAYASRGATPSAAKVLSAWLASDRTNGTARLLQCREQFRSGRVAAGERALEVLLNDAADRGGWPRVLAFARAYYTQSGRVDVFVAKLRDRAESQPADVTATAHLVDLLAGQRKLTEATRVLDATRAAVADDPDVLYEVAHLYERVGQKPMTEEVLRDVLRLDPTHASGANDLGYTLCEDGRDLERAESLTRQAVAADPSNASFLDSLGWVLYKRGRFDDARRALARAVELSHARGGGPDPVVLDHLGDVLYRAGDGPGAAGLWKQALARLAATAAPAPGADAGGDAGAGGPRDDAKALRLELERKAKQSAAGQPVSVAPLAPVTAREAAPEPVGTAN